MRRPNQTASSIEMTGRVYFITAAGTDLGKTYVAAALARALLARGRRVRTLKPVLSGYRDAEAAGSDAGLLLAACGAAVTPAAIADIAPWRFSAPLSPDRAAALEGRRIEVAALTAWCRDEIARNQDTLLIEGIGGVMVPLDEGHTVRDWIAALDLPVLLVTGTYLGAVSHTLTALAALREVGVRPAAIVVNRSVGGVDIADTLASLVPHLGGVPALDLGCGDTDRPPASALADWLDAATP